MASLDLDCSHLSVCRTPVSSPALCVSWAAGNAAIDSVRTSNVASLAEAAAAEQHREWLRKAAVASAAHFDPSKVPTHTHDGVVAELQGAAHGIAATAAAYDAADG